MGSSAMSAVEILEPVYVGEPPYLDGLESDMTNRWEHGFAGAVSTVEPINVSTNSQMKRRQAPAIQAVG